MLVLSSELPFRASSAFSSCRSPRCGRAAHVRAHATAAHKDGAKLQTTTPSFVISRRPLLGLASAAAAAAALLAGTAHTANAASRLSLFQQYYDKTDEIHAALHRVLEVDPQAADSDEALGNVKLFRDEANDWVGSYRGTMSVGRKSFAETYAAINTIQGHYTSRGATAPLPPKQKASAEKKLASAETSLTREKAKDATPAPTNKK